MAAAGVTDDIDVHAVLELIAVQPDQQGKGYGRALLAYVEGFAREKGATSVVVESASPHAEEIGFFERYGYTPRLVASIGSFEVLVKDL